MNDDEKFLYEAILEIKNLDECINFFRDLCTPQEIKSLSERIKVANILLINNSSYREICKNTGISLTTIVRVARFLFQEPYQGYKTILTRIKRH